MPVRMIEEGSRCICDPRAFDRDTKKGCCERGAVFRCLCRDDVNLRYRFIVKKGSSAKPYYALIPLESNGKVAGNHAEGCDFNAQYEKLLDRINPVKIDPETRMLRAVIHENISKRPMRKDKDTRDSHKLIRQVALDGVPVETHIDTLIKSQNLETGYRNAHSKRGFIIKDTYDYAKQVFMGLSEVEVAHGHKNRRKRRVVNCIQKNPDGSITPTSRDEDRFFYNMFKDAMFSFYREGERVTVSLSGMGYNVSAFFSRLDELREAHYASQSDGIKWDKPFIYRPMIETLYKKGDTVKSARYDITQDALYYGFKHFARLYRPDIIEDRDHIVATGYSYPMWPDWADDSVYIIDRLYLFPVNANGLYVESRYEAEAFDTIFELAKKDRGLSFYKPYRFSRYAYTGSGFDFIEDGIIEYAGCRKVGVLEVFGINNEIDYEAREHIKESYIDTKKDQFVFIPWRPYKESIEDFKKTLVDKIQEIKASRISV